MGGFPLPTDKWQFMGLIAILVVQLFNSWQNRMQLQKQEITLKNQDLVIQKTNVVLAKTDVVLEKTGSLEEKVNGLTEARVEAAKDVGAMEERRRIQSGSHD